MRATRSRVFLALFPDRPIRSELGALTERLKEALDGPGCRWVLLDHLHLTVRFLGELAVQDEEDVSAACEAVLSKMSAPEILLAPPGLFSAQRGSRAVLWAGIDDPDQSLHQLERALSRAVRPLNLAKVSGKFRPHITLARLRGTALARLDGTQLAPPRPLPWRPRELALVRSFLHPDGAEYRLLRSFPFKPGI